MFISLLAGWALIAGQPQSDFELRHAAALKARPAGLTATLQTRNGRTTFNLFEPIPLEAAFSSSRPNTYSIEIKEGYNAAGVDYWFAVDRLQDTIRNEEPGTILGIVCCMNERPYLTSRPTVLTYQLGNFLRFEKAGRYQVYYTTRRVFHGLGPAGDQGHGLSDFTTVTNILTLTILPDDPDWDRQQLATLLGIIKNPARRPAEKAGASHALSLLDTPEGIEARINELDNTERAKWMFPNEAAALSRNRSSMILYTTRPDLVCAALESRALQPDFAITSDFARTWMLMLMRRDHRERYLATEDRRQAGETHLLQNTLLTPAYREMVDKLESALPGKREPAREITAATLAKLREDLAKTESRSQVRQ